MNIQEILKWRYSTKVFDSSKKLSISQIEGIEDLLQLCPSSVNTQPWHFILAESHTGKEKIAKAVKENHRFNEQKILDASLVVVFSAKKSLEASYLKTLIEQEDRDGRFPNELMKEQWHQGRVGFSNAQASIPHWLENQVYLNIGSFLTGLAVMGLDALPMEGADLTLLDKQFELDKKNLHSLAIVAVGIRKEDDFNIPTKTPKSRLPKSRIITKI